MVYAIIRQLSETSSTNAKREILKHWVHNNLLRDVFELTECRSFNFYIRYNKKVGEIPFGTEDLGQQHLKVFHDLNTRVITGNAARDAFESVLFKLNQLSQGVFINILNRDQRCNVGTSLLNATWSALINDYPVMLAGKFDKKAISKAIVEKPGFAFVQNKEDGGRLCIHVSPDGVVQCFSRNGKEVNLHGVFDEFFSQFPSNVFDGELIIPQPDGKPNRQLGNGNYTRAVRGTITKEEADLFQFVTWDVIPLRDHKIGFCNDPYHYRFGLLTNMVNKIANNKVALVESKLVDTYKQVEEFYQEKISEGQEGIIFKAANMQWENRRSKLMLKMKAEETCDLYCYNVLEGEGKYAGMIGSLLLSSADGKLTVGVGTGLTDKDRGRDIDYYLNKVIEVKYNQIISSKDKTTKSLFLPVYVNVRLDKTKADSLHEIK